MNVRDWARQARIVLLTVACSLATGPSGAQQNVATAQKTLQAAFEAYNAKDYETFTTLAMQAADLNPHSVATRYYLARGYALTGETDKALEVLEYLAALGVDYGYAEHANFESLRKNAEFKSLTSDLADKLTPRINGRHRYTIDQLGIIPEGIARDPGSDRLFISSMRTGDIYALDSENNLSLFATVKSLGTMAAIGLYVDSSRELLWAVGATFEMTREYDPEAEQETGAFAFDLTTGELRKKVLAGGAASFFNDLTVAADGSVFLTGSQLCVIAPESERVERLTTSPEITGTNGIAVSPDGKYLFTSSYPAGIWVVELASGNAEMLSLPEGTTLYGTDGMYFHDGDLIAVQNGVEPWRVARVSLSRDKRSATAVRILELGNPDVGPTTGAIDGDLIHLVGQAPAPDQAPGQFPTELLQFLGKTVIYSVPLD